MNLKKIVSIVAIAIVAVVAGGLIYLSFTYSSLVKAGVEEYGPRYTQTKVELGGVSASLFGGDITINDFLVGNPQGYKTPHAFKVTSVKVDADMSSLTGDTIRITEIVIEAPDIIYELGDGARSNLQTIQDNVAKAAGGGKAKTADSGGEGPKVVIDNVYIRNIKVALSAGMLGGKTVPVPVPDMHLKDIGKDGDGATVADATNQVMDSITKSVTDAASSINLDEVRKQMEGLGKDAGDAAKGVTDSIKGLFGK